VNDGRIFAVRQRSERVFPGFQFAEDGQPRDVVRRVLEVLDRTGWELAAWFVSPNAWLDGSRPVDVLDDDRVVEAAEHDAAVPW
jgi:hypothetical protein